MIWNDTIALVDACPNTKGTIEDFGNSFLKLGSEGGRTFTCCFKLRGASLCDINEPYNAIQLKVGSALLPNSFEDVQCPISLAPQTCCE